MPLHVCFASRAWGGVRANVNTGGAGRVGSTGSGRGRARESRDESDLRDVARLFASRWGHRGVGARAYRWGSVGSSERVMSWGSRGSGRGHTGDEPLTFV